MQNAHAAAGGHLDEESSAAIEEQIEQQLAGKTVTPQKDAEIGEPNLVPAGNITRHEAPAILGEPDLTKNSQKEKKVRACCVSLASSCCCCQAPHCR